MRPLILLIGMIAQTLQNASFAQVNVTSLELGQSTGWLSYSFPFITSSNKQVAKKINAYLQQELLGNDTILTDTNQVFEKSQYISNEKVYQAGLSEISYLVQQNNSGILSLVFRLETTGAYSENLTRYYNFNSRTGERLRAEDLFTPEGSKEFCFPHVARPYDTDLDIEIPVEGLTKYLSEMGKELLLQKK